MHTRLDKPFPLFLSWDITYACNCKCLHCYNCSGSKLVDELDKNEAMEVCNQIIESGVMKVDMVGGEPLLQKHIFEVTKYLSDNNIICTLITNGSLLTKKNVSNIARLFSAVQVSIDGIGSYHDGLRGIPGCFDKAVKGIEYLKNLGGVEITITSVITKTNAPMIHKILELADQLGVRNVKLSKYLPTGRGYRNRSMLRPSQASYKLIKRELTEKGKNTDMQVEWEDPLKLLRKPFLPINTSWISLSANGYLLPNPFFPFAIGNLKTHTLNEYWESGLTYSEFGLADILRYGQEDELIKFNLLYYLDIIDDKARIVPFTGERYEK